MPGGDEVAADEQREGQHAAGLDVVLVGAELAEERAQVLHAPVVDPAQPLGDLAVAARPVPERQLDREIDRRGQLEELLQLGSRVGRLALDARDDVLDPGLLPGVEHLVEQRLAILEVPVEAALGHPEGRGQRLDPHGVRASGGQRLQRRVDPGAAWSPDVGHRHIYTAPY